MIEVVRVAGLATVQDGGRRGHMHEGVPRGGPLVPELLARANAAVFNGHETAAIELFGAMTLRAHAPVLVATDDGVPHVLGEGDARDVACGRARVTYVAVRGGIDVPPVLGGRGTLLVAGFGGHRGRSLRVGDQLPVGNAPPRDVGAPDAPSLHAAVHVVLGPDLERFDDRAVELLLGSTFAVDLRSDRTGTRLSGAALPRRDPDIAPSSPMVRGAIQVPASGMPIVLGPDHPTTGGYPVIATVVRSALGAFGAHPLGAPVRFSLRP